MKPVRQCIAFIRYLFRRYAEDGCRESAAALTYTSLFAVVPLMTVSYAVLSAIPDFQSAGDELRSLVFSHVVPSTGTEIESYLAQFSTQARKLSGIGVAFLAITAYLMLKNIETTFNKIWRTHQHRRGLSNFLLYWAILSLGPIFIGLGLAITTYLLSFSFLSDNELSGFMPLILETLPLVLTVATFTLLFTAVPNCHVPLKHSLAGGIVTAIALELAKLSFTSLVSNTSYQLIYGTFAAIPLFLIWIYLSWLIILLGAEFVRALSSHKVLHSSEYPALLLSIALFRELYQRQAKGQTFDDDDITTRSWLFGHSYISAHRWQSLCETLLEQRLIYSAGDMGYVLNIDLNNLDVWQLASRLPNGLNIKEFEEICSIREPQCEWLHELQALLTDLCEHTEKKLQLPVATLSFTQ
ncbi:tRNA-processing RNAse BN [Sinobacterium caligoides]|uniref:UPF0761 membrane protein EDC56_1598 n=1 Tax=Sinobacterium caligoides TaxID=933926 RepID=A0A3N2DN24_9GAMM|nr:YihY family inner membrane protein [Sinobacterium caligoides]ROS01170.1 tRNA-processing RNAse BN [Sinobacterium caligoides]